MNTTKRIPIDIDQLDLVADQAKMIAMIIAEYYQNTDDSSILEGLTLLKTLLIKLRDAAAYEEKSLTDYSRWYLVITIANKLQNHRSKIPIFDLLLERLASNVLILEVNGIKDNNQMTLLPPIPMLDPSMLNTIIAQLDTCADNWGWWQRVRHSRKHKLATTIIRLMKMAPANQLVNSQILPRTISMLLIVGTTLDKTIPTTIFKG